MTKLWLDGEDCSCGFPCKLYQYWGSVEAFLRGAQAAVEPT